MKDVLPAAVAAFAAAAATAFFASPAAARLGSLLGVEDEPGGRRLHDRAIPRLGGAALFLGLVAGSLVYGAAFGWERLRRTVSGGDFAVLVGPCAFVFLVGLVDDVRGLGPGTRVVAEVLAAGVLIGNGYVIDLVATPFEPYVDLHLLRWPVTILWFVAVTNAFNLVDGIDGLLAVLGMASLAGCAGVAFAGGAMGTGVLALALAGSLAGFLRWNWHPARVFLGDSGSLLVGFIVAALSIKVARTPAGGVLLHVPLLLCAVPIGETLLTLARRHVNGRPYFAGDQSHVHHVLVKSGVSVPRVVASLGAVAAVLAAVAVLSVALPWRQAGALAAIGILVAAAALALRRMRYVEVRVILHRLVEVLHHPRPVRLPDLAAVARAGDCVRGAASPADLRDRLRAAVVQGGFTFLALELTGEAARSLGSAGDVIEARNPDAAARAAAPAAGRRWIFSTEASSDPGRRTPFLLALPIPAEDGRMGRIVCHRWLDAGVPAPPEQDLRRYLAEPVAEAIESMAARQPGGVP